VVYNLLHVPNSVHAPPTPVRPVAPRGRPRQVTREMSERMFNMYASGQYTHAAIATALGVSKSTVSHYLRQAPAELHGSERAESRGA